MEAAAEGAVGLSEARDESPLSVAAASDDGDTVVGVSYGMDAADMGMVPVICSPQKNPTRVHGVCFTADTSVMSVFDAVTRKSRLISASKGAGKLG